MVQHFAFWQRSHYGTFMTQKINNSIRSSSSLCLWSNMHEFSCFSHTRWHAFRLLHQRLALSHATWIYYVRIQGASGLLGARDVRLWKNRYAKLNCVKLQSMATVKIIHRPFVSGQDCPVDKNALLPQRRAWKLKLFKFFAIRVERILNYCPGWQLRGSY